MNTERVRPVTRRTMSTASAHAVAPSYIEALAISMPVSSATMVWNSKTNGPVCSPKCSRHGPKTCSVKRAALRKSGFCWPARAFSRALAKVCTVIRSHTLLTQGNPGGSAAA